MNGVERRVDDLDDSRSGEHQNVGARGVLRGVELRCLHVQSSAAAKHRASGHGVYTKKNKKQGVTWNISRKLFSIKHMHNLEMSLHIPVGTQ